MQLAGVQLPKLSVTVSAVIMFIRPKSNVSIKPEI